MFFRVIGEGDRVGGVFVCNFRFFSFKDFCENFSVNLGRIGIFTRFGLREIRCYFWVWILNM